MKLVISYYSSDQSYKWVFYARLSGKTLWIQFNGWLKGGKLGNQPISLWVMHPLFIMKLADNCRLSGQGLGDIPHDQMALLPNRHNRV